MKELDVLLERFCDQIVPTIGEADTQAFEKLLDANDLELNAWILGRSPPPDPETASLIEKIRSLS